MTNDTRSGEARRRLLAWAEDPYQLPFEDLAADIQRVLAEQSPAVEPVVIQGRYLNSAGEPIGNWGEVPSEDEHYRCAKALKVGAEIRYLYPLPVAHPTEGQEPRDWKAAIRCAVEMARAKEGPPEGGPPLTNDEIVEFAFRTAPRAEGQSEQDVQGGSWVFDVYFPGDPLAGLPAFHERVTVSVGSNDFCDDEEWVECLQETLAEWFAGSDVRLAPAQDTGGEG